jgi:cysteine desulfurase
MHGGGHEGGLRAGTLPTHQIVGMGEAARLVREQLHNDVSAVKCLDSRLLQHLDGIECVSFNGNQAHRVPGIVNVAFACVEGESLMMALKHVAISSGSACTSSRVEPSHVLIGLGVDEDLASCSVRFSFGRYTTRQEIDFTAACTKRTVDALRQLSPDWHSPCDHAHPSTTVVVA